MALSGVCGLSSSSSSSSLTQRRCLRQSSKPNRLHQKRGSTFVRAAAFGVDDIPQLVTTVKETELELSRGIWRAVDAAGARLSELETTFAVDAMENAQLAAATAVATALDALPDPVRERVGEAAAAAYAALPPELAAAASDAAAAVGSSPVSAAAAAAIFLTIAPRLLPGVSNGSATAGMDEWAALAAREGDDEPAELQNYDPKKIQSYFVARPLTLIRRGIRSGSLLGSYGFALWLDKKILGDDPDEKKKAKIDEKRAVQLRDLLISLGPTYVKLGQVLSSRQDLLPAPYIRELRTLQDSVPPFDDDLARRILAAELGPSGARNLELDDKPIASASLGQVYRGKLKGNDGTTSEVAGKVQRPGALVAICLDICIIRVFAEPWRKFQNLNTDFEGLVDEWGTRFVDELDYTKEADNGERFRLAMESRPDLAGVVTAAPVERGASTRRVITTGWIDGQRLDTSEEGDVPRLCAVALASYLAMLLDIGVLHADPHPGNLFRTEDGKLCILDWGLVTPVSSDLSKAILNFIAHLVSKDFESVPGDLDALGFIPKGKKEAMEDAGVASAIAVLFSALAKGGGADGFRAELGLPDQDRIKEIRKELKGVKDMKARRDAFIEASGGAESKVAQLTRDLEGIQEKYGNIFQIPSYFGYILRSFSVLEGIGLASDKNYSIANECYPYVARRLLTDPSPDTRAALEQLLYGRSGPKSQLSVKRVKQLANAFGNYSTLTATAGGAEGAGAMAAGVNAPSGGADSTALVAASAGGSGDGGKSEGKGKLNSGAKEALRLAFAPDGGPVQDILLREMARYAGAAASELATSAATAPASAFVLGLARAQQQAADSLGPARPPLPTAIEFFAPLTAAAQQTEADRETLRVAEELQDLAANLMAARGGGSTAATDAATASTSTSTWVEVPVFGEVPVPALPGMPEVDQELLRELAEMAPELAPGAQAAALRFGSVLLDQAAERVSYAEHAAKMEKLSDSGGTVVR